jgi:hypothetical protein
MRNIIKIGAGIKLVKDWTDFTGVGGRGSKKIVVLP